MPILAVPKPDYAATLTVLNELPELLEAKRQLLGLTGQQQAKSIGIAQSTLTNLYRGSNPQMFTVVLCLRWLAAH